MSANSKFSSIKISLKNKFKLSPLNNFFNIPEIVIDKIAKYKSIWFNLAKNTWPLKILGFNFGVGLSILFTSLMITI